MKLAKVCGFELWVPDHVAAWDAVIGDSRWEYERIHDILETLQWGDMLMDIGVEHGWMSAIFAKFGVGGDSMILAEPSPEFWSNIYRCWKANDLSGPAGCWAGFVASESDLPLPEEGGWWPEQSKGPECDAMAYRYLHDGHHIYQSIPRITIDDLVARTREPVGITMDIEGAEYGALLGAQRTLTDVRPHVWVSIHPDLMARDYQTDREQILTFMNSLDYHATQLAVDHEEHWYFEP